MRIVAVSTVALGILAWEAEVRAGNEDSFFFGDQASLTGGAVVASARDAASIWYNPAGLAQNDRARLELGGTAFNLRARPIPKGVALDLPSGRIESGIKSLDFSVAPTALTAVRALGRGVSVGLGLFVTEQDTPDYARSFSTSDRTTNLELAGALSATVIRYHAGPALGIRVTRDLRLGAAVFGVYEKDHEFRKLFVDGQMSGAYQTTFLQRLVDATSYSVGAEALVGAQLDAGDGWQAGLAVRSPRLVFYYDQATDDSTVVESKGPGVPTVAISAVNHTPLSAQGRGLTRAPRITTGVAKREGPVEISGEVEYRPSGVGGVYAERAVVNVRTGVLWTVRQDTLLGMGVFTDRTGAGPPGTFPDARVDYQGLAVGWKQRHSVRLHAREAAGSLLFSTTVAVRYALGVGQSTRIRFDFREAPTTGLVGRVADEQVSVVYHEASVYLGTGLEF
jgi:hypothetical protein